MSLGRISAENTVLVVVVGIVWALSVAHPWSQLKVLDERPPEASSPNQAARFVRSLSENGALMESLRDIEVVDYVTEGALDLRRGGPRQQRFYLSQYALVPTLLDHRPIGSQQDSGRDLILAYFEDPGRLDRFLAERSLKVVVRIAPNIALARRRVD